MSKATISSVRRLNVINNSTSSIIQLGDREHTYLYGQGIAILRSKTIYGTDEPYFESYPMFCTPVPPLHWMLPEGKVSHDMYGKLVPLPNQNPTIEVDRVSIITSSSSSNIQFGNGSKFIAENRRKNIRQFLHGLGEYFPL